MAGGRRYKIIAAVLAVVAIGLACVAALQFRSLLELRSANAQLTGRLADDGRKELTAARAACADHAASVFSGMGYSDKDEPGPGGETHSYTDHYNPTLKRCLMELTTEKLSATAPTQTTTRAIFDADERTDFGSYMWFSSETKKYWEQPPFMCRMTLPGKPETLCHSTEEWEKFVRSLME